MDRIDEKIQEAYITTVVEGKKVFVSAYWDGNVLKWRTEDGRTGSDPMKKTTDKKAIEKHFKKVLGSNVELELIKESVDESIKNTFGGYHLKDDILAGITVEDLQTALYSNIPKEKLNAKTVKKEFDSMVKANMKDSIHILSKVARELVQDLQSME